jgi:hypothetical protein
MKITAFNGSPWGEQGHTHVMIQEFLNGASEAGAKVEIIDLCDHDIKICKCCGVCFYKTPGKCAVKDDMGGLIKKFLKSDAVIFGTPVYMDNVTATMKIFIDRLNPILDPHYEKDPEGEYRRCGRYDKYPGILVISSCAMPEQGSFEVLRFYFRRLARTLHTEVVGEIYRGDAGLILLSKEDIRFKAAVDVYKELLHEAGREFALTGRISEQMRQRLEAPIIEAEEYIRYANKMWEQILAKEHYHKLGV